MYVCMGVKQAKGWWVVVVVGWDGAYHGLLCGAALTGSELGLEVHGRVEVSAGITGAPALDSIHANCHRTLVCCAHVIRRVSEAALLL